MAGITYIECLSEAARTPALVAEFDRLTGHHLSQVGSRSPINAAIDEATGRDTKALNDFCTFVLDCVYLRLPPV